MRIALSRKAGPWLKAVAVLLSCVVAMCVPDVSHARVAYVDDDASPGVGDGSPGNPFGLISEAMDTASAGDTVAVRPGLYSEYIGVDMHDSMGMNTASVVIKDGVALCSTAGPESTTILGTGCEAVVYFGGSSSASALIGFTLELEGVGWGLRAHVLCYAAQPLIHGNVIEQLAGGIFCRAQSSPTISGNHLPHVPISMSDGSGGLISDNTIVGRIGVSSGVESSFPILIEGNTIGSDQARSWEDIGIAVTAGGPGDVLVYDNTIQWKDVGAEVCRGTFWHNRFVNNTVNLRAKDYCETWEDIDAVENWWGTADSLEVGEKIIDCHDDAELEPCVSFEPWCMNDACTATAVHGATWTSVKALFR